MGALLLSGFRLAQVDAFVLKQRRSVRRERQLFPKRGTFAGIDTAGHLTQAALGPSSRLLLFVIHSRSLATDVEYWNRVVRSVQGGEVGAQKGISYWYWGVCDAGAACNAYQSRADFRIIAFMEPYEMRIAAMLGAKRQAAVYDQNSVLAARIPVLQRAEAEAQAVLKEGR